MTKEEILLSALNEYGKFENVREQFDGTDLDVIFESMERYKGQSLPIDSVVDTLVCNVCYRKTRNKKDDEGYVYCTDCDGL